MPQLSRSSSASRFQNFQNPFNFRVGVVKMGAEAEKGNPLAVMPKARHDVCVEQFSIGLFDESGVIPVRARGDAGTGGTGNGPDQVKSDGIEAVEELLFEFQKPGRNRIDSDFRQ